MRITLAQTDNHIELEKIFEMKKEKIETKEDALKKEKFKILRKSSLRGVADNLNKYKLDCCEF